jgi:hypothetical protein
MLILKAVQLTLYTMERFSPFMGDPAPTVNIHTASAFAGRYTDSCNALPEICKLKRALHLLN